MCVALLGAVNEIPLYGGVAERRGGHDITRLLPSFVLFSSLIRFHPIIVSTPLLKERVSYGIIQLTLREVVSFLILKRKIEEYHITH